MNAGFIKLLTHVSWVARINLRVAFYISLICALWGTLSIIGIFEYKLFYINESDSAPHGIYVSGLGGQEKDGGFRIELLIPGSYYLVKLPVDIPVLDKKAGFNLIKLCCALPETAYTVTDNEMIIGGRRFHISDKTGLPHLKPGKYYVPADAALFLNETDTSFDSRYLGPINRQYIKGILYYIGPKDTYIFLGQIYIASLLVSFLLYLCGNACDGMKSMNNIKS